MRFEDMKMIWDSQKDRPMYAIDQEALHATVRRKGRCIDKYVNMFEIAMIGILLITGLFLVGEPILFGRDNDQYVGGILMLAGGAYLIDGRRRRRQRDAAFDTTILGEVNLALARLDYQVGRLKGFVWWFLAPAAVTLVLSLLTTDRSRPWWVWAAFFASLPVALVGLRHDLRKLAPKRRELESLRDLLTAENGG